MIAYLIQGFSLGISAAATPGPFQAYIINQSLKNGWRRTLPAALAPLFSDGPIVALVLLFLSAFPAAFLQGIQIAGGVFVLYLAIRAFLAWRNYRAVRAAPLHAGRQSLFQAVMMNCLSPGPYLFWSLIGGPILLRGWGQASTWGLSFMAGFYFALVGGQALLIVFFGAAQQLGPLVSRALLGVSALLLAGFGVYQLIQGVFYA